MTYPQMPTGWQHLARRDVSSTGEIIGSDNPYDTSLIQVKEEVFTSRRSRLYDPADHLAHVEATLTKQMGQIGEQLKEISKMQGKMPCAPTEEGNSVDQTVKNSVEDLFAKMMIPMQEKIASLKAKKAELKRKNAELEERIKKLETNPQ